LQRHLSHWINGRVCVVYIQTLIIWKEHVCFRLSKECVLHSCHIYLEILSGNNCEILGTRYKVWVANVELSVYQKFIVIELSVTLENDIFVTLFLSINI
jgi:hypothetical protein